MVMDPLVISFECKDSSCLKDWIRRESAKDDVVVVGVLVCLVLPTHALSDVSTVSSNNKSSRDLSCQLSSRLELVSDIGGLLSQPDIA